MLLSDVYTEIYPGDDLFKKANLVELAEILSDIAARAEPWTWRYLHGVLKGYRGFSISPELERALTILANKLDGRTDLQARAREITVLTVNSIDEGSLVMGHTQRCPECLLKFVPNHPRRVYCPECRPPRAIARSPHRADTKLP